MKFNFKKALLVVVIGLFVCLSNNFNGLKAFANDDEDFEEASTYNDIFGYNDIYGFVVLSGKEESDDSVLNGLFFELCKSLEVGISLGDIKRLAAAEKS